MSKISEEVKTGVYINSDFYKDSYDYYSAKFIDMPGVSWNTSAFVFTFSWFAYRKMYFWALIFGLIDAMCSTLTIIAGDLAIYIGGFMLVVNLVAGLFGNAIYYNHVRKLSAKTEKLSKSEAREFIRKMGGSSVPAVIFFAVAMALLTSFSDIIAEVFFSI